MRSLTKIFTLILMLGVGLTGLSPQRAEAKNLSQMLFESGIEPESLSLMQDHAKELYTAKSKSIGDEKEWANPETGTKGTVEIVDLKNSCVQVFHNVNVVRLGKETQIRVWWCKTASGDWQLTANP